MVEFDALFFVTVAAMFVGLLGSVLPGLPGVPLIFVAGAVYAYFTDFAVVGGWVLALMGVFAALAIAADFIGTAYGARRFGASGYGTIGGAVGGLVGTLLGALVFGVGAIFGLILGSIAGVFAGEYIKRNRQSATRESSAPEGGPDWGRISRAAGGVLVGYVLSAIVQGTLAVASVAAFVLALIY